MFKLSPLSKMYIQKDKLWNLKKNMYFNVQVSIQMLRPVLYCSCVLHKWLYTMSR